MNEKTKNVLFVSILVILLSLASFGIGRLSTIQDSKTPVKIDYLDEFESSKSLQAAGVILTPKADETLQEYSDR